jgi:hypothetical protein
LHTWTYKVPRWFIHIPKRKKSVGIVIDGVPIKELVNDHIVKVMDLLTAKTAN